MIRCVIDASVTLAWSFEDEDSPYADSVFELLKTSRAAAPSVWPLEVGNGLISAIRKGRLTESDASRMLTVLLRLSLDIDAESSRVSLGQRILELGLLHRLSAYDATYLELAIRRGLPLATQDTRLVDAALAAGVELLRP